MHTQMLEMERTAAEFAPALDRERARAAAALQRRRAAEDQLAHVNERAAASDRALADAREGLAVARTDLGAYERGDRRCVACMCQHLLCEFRYMIVHVYI